MIRIPLDSVDRIALPAAIANGLNSRELTLASRSQRHLLFTTEGGGEGQITLAGSIGDLQVVEVLSIINMFRKSGLLHFSLEGGSKDLHFDEGELVSATSTFPEEELGEFLLIAGKIDRDTLIKTRQAAGHDPQALRLQLLQGGRLTEQDLHDAGNDQIEAIVYHLIPCQQGDFIFVQRRNTIAPTSSLALRTQNLIMEGLRRSDERQLFMRTLHSHNAIPVATGHSVDELPAKEERLLAMASSGKLTVRDLIARSGLGEFQTLSLLHRLAGRRLLTFPTPETPELSAELTEILAIANGVLAALYQKISEKNHNFGLEMRLFLRDLPQPFATVLRHVTLSDKGTIAPDQIAANLAKSPADEQRSLLAETLSELVFMACMAARRDLGDNHSDSLRLVQQAQEIAVRINQLKERKNS
ncbi:MAG: DUF4388 domain-containing protein [Desulfuromonadales bacterium]|nr:DUF4388 domain-containing protein [Desulfuromonadales bacterium]